MSYGFMDLSHIGSGNSLSTIRYHAITWTSCPVDPQEQTFVKFKSQYHNFHSRKCIEDKCLLQNAGHLVQTPMC